jgi:hypothetical protein
MTSYIIGTCSNCRGAVTVYLNGTDATPPKPRCAQCGASPVHPYGPVIPMGPVPISPVAKIMREVSGVQR